MNDSLDSQVRAQVARYLSGDVSLAEFQAWFVPRSWDLPGVGEEPAKDLCQEIELALAEYTSGHRTEGELRRLLGDLVRPRVTGERGQRT